MLGRKPETILTDQSASIACAIADVFPETCHRLCAWKIYQNATENLSYAFHPSWQFVSVFSLCLNDYEEEEEWLMAWNTMLEKYNLQAESEEMFKRANNVSQQLLKDLLGIKRKWSLVALQSKANAQGKL
ncbi:hypothetical protein NL676_030813 [Syzygium grande]|nr:hypothetical protein NL676_030813 [Syzygium grande]